MRVALAAEETAMVYTFAGDGDGTLRVYDGDGDEVVLTNEGTEASEHLVLGGAPLREPVARYGPFVMNTSDEIDAAMRRLPVRPLRRDRPLTTPTGARLTR